MPRSAIRDPTHYDFTNERKYKVKEEAKKAADKVNEAKAKAHQRRVAKLVQQKLAARWPIISCNPDPEP